MRGRYLEVTFRKGRPIAAYLYLPRRAGDHSTRASRTPSGLVIDYGKRGDPIGIEITVPEKVSLAALNRVLARLEQPPLTADELAPLMAA